MKHRYSGSLLSLLGLTCLLGIPAWSQTPPVAPAAAPSPMLCPPPLPSGTLSLVPLDRPIILAEAVQIALREQPQLAISSAAAEAAAGRTRQATSTEYPTFSLSASYNRTGSSVTAGSGGTPGVGVSSGGYTTTISGSQLLFDFGRTQAQIAQARNQQTAAQYGVAQTQQEVINQVKQAYYSLLQNQRLVGVQQQNLRDQQEHLNLARARFDVGLAPRADIIRAEAAVAQAQFDVVTAENTTAQTRVNLNLAMGIDVRTPTLVQETEEPLPSMNIAALIEQALLQRPDIRQLQSTVRAAEEGVRLARATRKPDVFADVSYGLRGDEFPPENRSWSYGVSVSWPFFDVGLTRGRIEEAEANVAGARAQLRQGEQGVGQEVTQAFLNVQAASQQVTTAGVGVTAAEESLRVAIGRYEAGVAAYIEVLDAETALLQARTSQVNALYGLSTARANLARALGIEGI